MILRGKNILLGITAGIAAYKTCELVRLFIKSGANVKVIMSENAEKFVSPIVLATLSNNKVYLNQFDYTDYDVEHVALSNWADMFVIAPLTANTLSKIAHGICDNLLTTTVCAFNKEILLVPAMNVNMYENSIIQENLNLLKTKKFNVLEPEEGFLACGVNAKGRMSQPENIMQKTIEIITRNKKNKTILVTAGGTKENIDPVRYIGNYSSGKMGIAIADEAYKIGFDVVLISTVNVDKPYKVINVKTADEMLISTKEEFKNADYLIMAAAVADFKPIAVAQNKIKKNDNAVFTIELTQNPDILKEIAFIKTDKQKVIGFCAESENLFINAENKLKDKNLDFIVANDISRNDIGFSSDYNEVTILAKNGDKNKLSRMLKVALAKKIIEICVEDN